MWQKESMARVWSNRGWAICLLLLAARDTSLQGTLNAAAPGCALNTVTGCKRKRLNYATESIT
mgnify:CR=1 FL=1